jgi:D-alanine-D-alanine ligase
MQQISLQAFEALNLRDFARVDIRVDKDNNIYLLEINSMASLGHSGSYITAAKAAGYNFNTLVNKMLDVASVRYFSNQINPANPEAGLDSKISKSVKIRSFLKTRHQNTENLLKKITDINTFARNIEGVNSCQEIICNELSPLGFKMEIFPHLEIGNTIYLSNNINGETDYLLLASVDNNQKLDQQEAFTKNEQYYEGTGVWENKGGIAVMVAALQALRFTRDLKRLKIGILLLSDSSLNGKYSKKLIHEKSRNSKNIIGLSGAGKNGALVVSRSGSAIYKLSLKLRKKDKSQNVALASQQFNNILTKIGRISNQDEDNIIAPYNINFKSNIFKITAFGTAGLSVRYNSEAILEEIEQKLKNIVMAASKYKELDVQLEGDMKRPPMLFSKQSRELYEKIKGIGKEIDLRISSEHRWSSNNICFAIDRIPQIDGFGPAGNFLTPGNERIFAHSIQEKALLLALFMSSNLQSP